MWIVWIVAWCSLALVAACAVGLRDEWTAAPLGWKLLAGSGLPLALAGLGFIVRFWEPTGGPFHANELYPIGPYLNAWAVSFGFMWVAFGLAFYAFTLRAPHDRKTWLALLAAWILAWVPHGIIAIGFAVAGDREASVRVYAEWASEWSGLAQLSASALVLGGHVALGLIGFGLTGRALLRRTRDDGSGGARPDAPA